MKVRCSYIKSSSNGGVKNEICCKRGTLPCWNFDKTYDEQAKHQPEKGDHTGPRWNGKQEQFLPQALGKVPQYRAGVLHFGWSQFLHVT